MQIEAIHEIDLTTEVETEIAAVLEKTFGADDGYDGRSFYKQRHHLRLVARENRQIISHVALAFREIRIGGDLFPIVGIGEVATLPDFQGRGAASALLKHAMADARSSRASFMVLFGNRPIYAGHGFVSKPNLVRFVGMDDCRTGEIIERRFDSLMILPLRDDVWDDDATVDLLGPLF